MVDTGRTPTLLVAHAVLGAVGLAALVAASWPLAWDGLWSAPSSGLVVLVVVSALVCGGIGGLVEGVALRTGHPVIGYLLAVVAAYSAFGVMELSTGRWGDAEGALGTTDLGLPLVGWLLFVGVLTGAATLVLTVRRRPTAPASAPARS